MAAPQIVDPRRLQRVRPSAPLIAGLAALALVAAGGWWLGGVSHSPAPAVVPDSVASVGDLRLEVEGSWVAADSAPGLDVAGARAFAPVAGLSARAVLVSGSPADATLIPATLRAELPEALPAPAKATLGGLAAWSYGPLRDRGRMLEVTVVPTTSGVLALACTAPPASWSGALDCAEGVHAIATDRARALAPTTDLAFRQAAGPALRALDAKRVAGRARLAGARRAAAANALARSHREAATALSPFVVPGAPADAVAALRDAAGGYAALATDPRRNRARFVAARARVARSDAALADALARLRR